MNGRSCNYYFLIVMLCAAESALSMTVARTSVEDQPSKVESGADAHFGPNLRSRFLLEDGYTNLNHGSYGSTPIYVFKAAHRWQAQMESSPDKWFRQTAYAELDKVRAQVARYVGVNSEDLAFVENASHGMNAILRSLITSDDTVLYLSLAYQMVKNTLAYLRDTFGAKLVEVPIVFPTTADEIVAAVQRALDANPGVKVASIDHITSCPAVRIPVARIAALCRARGVLVAVDGAHALGHIPLNLTTLGADFYVANAHKWLYSPKSGAILWVRKEHQGTADVTAYLAMAAALEFRRGLGGGEGEVVRYLHRLAADGAWLLAEGWGTDALVSGDLACAMVNVRLPPCGDDAVVAGLPAALLERYNTWVPAFKIQDRWYVRVSAQVYLSLSDFEMLRDAVLEILAACPAPSLAPSPPLSRDDSVPS